MNTSEIEIVEDGIRDGMIIAMTHYGPWPEEYLFPRLAKPNLSFWLMTEPACAELEIKDEITIDRYVNSGRQHNGRWIFVRKNRD